MLKLDHDRLIDENVALTVEIQNLRATQKSDGPPSDNDDGLSDISTDAARKRLLRMVKRAADGQLVCFSTMSYVDQTGLYMPQKVTCVYLLEGFK